MKRDRYSGKIINERYELIRLIDEGGMGAVYLGRDIRLGRKAAVKFLHSELTAGDASVKRFYREAQAASAVNHPNIISVFDIGVSEWGEPYLVMEYLAGETLGNLLKRKKLFNTATALGILEPALRGLNAAHEQNIIHRDLKPENIFMVRIPDGYPLIKLIDFGISKFSESDQPQLTRTGALLGTPSYMSPEQARGKGEFDHRADLYSMGVILYLMLSGEHPFVGQSYNDLIFNILTEPPRDPYTANPDFPKDVVPIVQRLLEKDPDKRYPDCKSVLAALESLDAYGERLEALAALGKEMQGETFATGDLGEGEFISGNGRPEDLAATVYAKTDSGAEAPKVVDALTAPATPHAKDSPKDASSATVGRQEDTQELSWDMIPSHMPPPHRRRDDRKSPWMLLFIVFLMFAVGVGVVFGLDLFYAPDTAAPDKGDAVASGDPAAEPKEVQDTALRNVHPDTLLVPGAAGEGAVEDTDAEGTETSVSDSETAQPDTSSSGELSGASVVAEENAAQKNQTEEKTTENRTSLSSKGNQLGRSGEKSNASTGKSEKVSGSSGGLLSSPSKAPGFEEDQEVPPAPFETVDNPLQPERIDRLLDSKSKRIQNCYDMARLADPKMEGSLVLVVGMAGDKVQVSVRRNETTEYLASCVKRVIKSIKPPPNDGTLVEILKEFEFRTAK